VRLIAFQTLPSCTTDLLQSLCSNEKCRFHVSCCHIAGSPGSSGTQKLHRFKWTFRSSHVKKPGIGTSGKFWEFCIDPSCGGAPLITFENDPGHSSLEFIGIAIGADRRAHHLSPDLLSCRRRLAAAETISGSDLLRSQRSGAYADTTRQHSGATCAPFWRLYRGNFMCRHAGALPEYPA
jgi:hypothetical protein